MIVSPYDLLLAVLLKVFICLAEVFAAKKSARSGIGGGVWGSEYEVVAFAYEVLFFSCKVSPEHKDEVVPFV